MCDRCVSKSGRLLGVGRTGLGTGSAAIALFIPKCPLCVAAWAWALSAAGIEFDRWDAIKWPLTVAFLLLAALLLGFRAKPWVQAAIVLGSGLCLSIKIAEDSTSFGPTLALGAALSALIAVAHLMLRRNQVASLPTH